MTIVRVVLALVVSLTTARFASAAEDPKTLADGPAVPVLAWGGVPSSHATPERYAELAAAGFTHNFSGASDLAAMRTALDVAHAAGVKQVVSIPELHREPEATARALKDHPGVGGYYLRDEPGANLFKELGDWAKRIQSADNEHPCYVNLFPTYGIPAQWETPDYQTYLDRFVAEVPTPMLSFDHYPVIGEDDKDAGHHLRPDFYLNLELASATAKKANRPLWAFALATAHNPYPIPTVAALRLQVFSDLAYGAQAIQYFTYWTTRSDVWNFHSGPIDVDGKRTVVYDRVRQVNAEMQALRGAFLGSKVVSVGHTGESVPDGTKRYENAAPVASFQTPGGGAVVSVLEKGGRRFLVVVNRSLQKPMPLRVAFDAEAGVRAVAKDGAVKPAALADHAADLEPGDVAIFTWAVK
jgi:hypothetical protein